MKKLKINRIPIDIFDEYVADYLFKKLKILEDGNNKINIALSGGKTPLPILFKLKDFSLKWEIFNFFLTDERNVPLKSKESNFGNLSNVFFNKITSKSFSIIKNGTNINESITHYKKEIFNSIKEYHNNIPVFDLILLGMGSDGHIASLFPKSKGLEESKDIIILNKIHKLNTDRITMTYPILLNAKEIVTIIKGKEKEKVLLNIQNKRVTNYPVHKITEHPNNIFLLGI